MEHYILEGKTIKVVDDLMEWARWFEKADRQVNKTDITDEISVSTIFLGLDHSFSDGPPLLFETMIFGGEHDQYQDRYATYEEAEAGHIIAVKLCGGKKIN